jgi:hypothetical protein
MPGLCCSSSIISLHPGGGSEPSNGIITDLGSYIITDTGEYIIYA